MENALMQQPSHICVIYVEILTLIRTDGPTERVTYRDGTHLKIELELGQQQCAVDNMWKRAGLLVLTNRPVNRPSSQLKL